MSELKKNNIKILKDIKCEHNIKEVFSFLYEKTELKIINFNKHLQSILGIDIKDYKKKCVKYRIGERNGLGKEYNSYTNVLIFEGEYINGKRHGKGKEYYSDGNLKFEGEYINGIRHGKGKNFLIMVN